MTKIKLQVNSKNSDTQKNSGKPHRKFVAAKTGRVIKPPYMPPRLGEERIQAAVEAFLKNHANL